MTSEPTPNMTYSSIKPEVDGYYWWKDTKDATGIIVRIVNGTQWIGSEGYDLNNGPAQHSLDNRHIDWAYSLWAGPIPEPEELP